MQTVFTSVNVLSVGLSQVNAEIRNLSNAGGLPAEDRFIKIMQVSRSSIRSPRPSDPGAQPFALQVGPAVDALKKMATALEQDLRSLLAYYGENPDSPEAPKPEEFFAMICSFSSSLQVHLLYTVCPASYSSLLFFRKRHWMCMTLPRCLRAFLRSRRPLRRGRNRCGTSRSYLNPVLTYPRPSRARRIRQTIPSRCRPRTVERVGDLLGKEI